MNQPLDDIKGVNLFQNPNLTPEQEKRIRESQGSGFTFPLDYDFDKAKSLGYYNPVTSCKIKHLQAKGLSLYHPNSGHLGYLFFFIDNTEIVQKTELLKNNLAITKAILLNKHSLIGEYDWTRNAIYIDPLLNDDIKKCSLSKYMDNNWIDLAKLREYLYDRGDIGCGDNPFIQVKQGKKQECSFDCHFQIDDEVSWIRFNAVDYRDNDTHKIFCYIRDITEEKLLEEELVKTQEKNRLAELERKKAQEADLLKSAFLANMSHEIRTPLNAIVGFSTLLLESDDPEEKSMYVDIINNNNNLLLQLISDILDFSKIEVGTLEYNFKEVSFKEIIFEQSKIHSMKMPENVSFICDLDVLPDVLVYTDAKRVTQVISNLLSNAEKYTEEGSISLSYKVDGDTLTVEVRDTGVGITPDKQSVIFDRFIKLDNFRQGTGLGLTICKTIIEALHGTIGVNSTPGQGSCFWFTLPIHNT